MEALNDSFFVQLPSSSSSSSHDRHVKGVKVFLRTLQSFKDLYTLFYTREVDARKEEILKSARETFSKVHFNNLMDPFFQHLEPLFDIAAKFSGKPMGIFLDILYSYLMTYLVGICQVKTLDDFKMFWEFLKNKIIDPQQRREGG